METKFCPDCGHDRPLADFYRTKAARYAGGYRYSAYCKEHMQQRNAQVERDAPALDRIRESKRKWMKAHPEVNRRAQAASRAKKKAQTGEE